MNIFDYDREAMDIKKLGEWFVGSFAYNANGLAKREQRISLSSHDARGDEQAVRLFEDSQERLISSENQARQAKVATLKQQIQAGKYNPDSREVAAVLFAELF